MTFESIASEYSFNISILDTLHWAFCDFSIVNEHFSGLLLLKVTYYTLRSFETSISVVFRFRVIIVSFIIDFVCVKSWTFTNVNIRGCNVTKKEKEKSVDVYVLGTYVLL